MLCIQMPWHVQDEMASAIRDGVQELREKLKVAEADSSYSLLHSSKTQTWDDSRTYAHSRLLGKASPGHLQTEWTYLVLCPDSLAKLQHAGDLSEGISCSFLCKEAASQAAEEKAAEEA